jgi:predicted kinase
VVNRQVLIIVTGYPATGKTTLSRRLAEGTGLLLINKDAIKERLADELGCEDIEASKKLGRATYVILDYFLESALQTGQSVIVESNFPAVFYTQKIRMLQELYHFHVVQLLCKAEPETLVQRMKQRVVTGERHFAHKDGPYFETSAFRMGAVDGRIDPLAVEGELIEVDTTDFTSVDYDALREWVRHSLVIG